MATRDRWDPRAAKHKPCPACKGSRGRTAPAYFAGMVAVDGTVPVPAGKTRWVPCVRCEGNGTLTRLCTTCAGTGGGLVRWPGGERWDRCEACVNTGRASGRGRWKVGGLTPAEVDELATWGTVGGGEALPPSSFPESPEGAGTRQKPDAPGADGVVGERRCRRGGGLHCLRATRDLCEPCGGAS